MSVEEGENFVFPWTVHGCPRFHPMRYVFDAFDAIDTLDTRRPGFGIMSSRHDLGNRAYEVVVALTEYLTSLASQLSFTMSVHGNPPPPPNVIPLIFRGFYFGRKTGAVKTSQRFFRGRRIEDRPIHWRWRPIFQFSKVFAGRVSGSEN